MTLNLFLILDIVQKHHRIPRSNYICKIWSYLPSKIVLVFKQSTVWMSALMVSILPLTWKKGLHNNLLLKQESGNWSHCFTSQWKILLNDMSSPPPPHIKQTILFWWTNEQNLDYVNRLMLDMKVIKPRIFELRISSKLCTLFSFPSSFQFVEQKN
jgi:hypothetical protein